MQLLVVCRKRMIFQTFRLETTKQSNKTLTWLLAIYNKPFGLFSKGSQSGQIMSISFTHIQSSLSLSLYHLKRNFRIYELNHINMKSLSLAVVEIGNPCRFFVIAIFKVFALTWFDNINKEKEPTSTLIYY